jgi:hypothetical protein
MKIKLSTSLLGLAVVFLSVVGCAQLGNLPGGSKSGGSAAVSAESLIEGYVKGSKLVISAQRKLNDALGLKGEIEKLGLKVENLGSNPTDSDIEDVSTFYDVSIKNQTEKYNDKSLKLAPASKEKFSAGLVNLVQGLIQYKSVASDATKYQPSATSIGGAAATAVNIAKLIPGDLSNLQNTLAAAIKFAQSNGIDVPKDATSALP